MDGAPAWIAAGVASVVALVSSAIAYGRAVAQIDSVKADVADMKAARHQGRDAAERLASDVGETMLAIRQSLTDAQMWNRDNFVRREDFKVTIDSINRNIDVLRTSMETSMSRVSDKLDKLSDDLRAPPDQRR
mgnify:FL=1